VQKETKAAFAASGWRRLDKPGGVETMYCGLQAWGESAKVKGGRNLELGRSRGWRLCGVGL
jgi:hypothetical protein